MPAAASSSGVTAAAKKSDGVCGASTAIVYSRWMK